MGHSHNNSPRLLLQIGAQRDMGVQDEPRDGRGLHGSRRAARRQVPELTSRGRVDLVGSGSWRSERPITVGPSTIPPARYRAGNEQEAKWVESS